MKLFKHLHTYGNFIAYKYIKCDKQCIFGFDSTNNYKLRSIIVVTKHLRLTGYRIVFTENTNHYLI